MSLLITMFGGMLLTALLYGIGRRAKLSNYWAAVVAAAIPSFAYLGYALGHPVGLDTITLHVIAYPTVSVLLAMMNGEKAKQQNNVHWAPKLLIGFFLVLMVLMASFVYIAGQGLPPAVAQVLLPHAEGKNVHTGFAGVVEHQEDAAKGIGQHLGMADKLEKLGWRVEVDGLGELRAGNPAIVAVSVADVAGHPEPGVTVDLALARPGQPATARLTLAAAGDRHRGTLPGLGAGSWVANLRLARGADVVVLEHAVEVH
ncbi:hypothetical protein EZJ19_02670 [Parasulfuritortus cantonensis]|uniref:Nitrogen fixation protein FixH n=1 Tax=Parasulfuritortus cantonensis TaxID=2528202 RepID=A0A4R1BLF8_9PROT|nr:hypothetical protein [Parasulfuritortus cantonensis]TCJ18157.1 hypothetical protein EZJ19_02670 [Parasulfuritortus cantonensis]